MNQIRVPLSLVAALAVPLSRAGCIALNVLFIAIMYLLTIMPANAAGQVNCNADLRNLPLDAYMCNVMRDVGNDVHLFLGYGGSGLGNTSSNAANKPLDPEYSASVTKLIPVFMMIEILANNQNALNREPGIPNYRRNGWTLDTMVRIVPDRNAIPATYDRPGPGIVYLSGGFASSICTDSNGNGVKDQNDGWDGVANVAQLSSYSKDPAFEYSIRELISLAMAPSFNDAAVVLGALIAANLATSTQQENQILGVKEPMRAQGNSGEHMTWIIPLRDVFNATARRLGAENTSICNPPGWAATASAGCSAMSTARDWAVMINRIYQQTVNNSGATPYYNLFAPMYTENFTVDVSEPRVPRAAPSHAGSVCTGKAEVMKQSTSLGLILATGGPGGPNGEPGQIKLAKSGTVDLARNLVAILEPNNTSSCSSQQMTGVVMGLSAEHGWRRQEILANMFAAARRQFSQCTLTVDLTRIPVVRNSEWVALSPRARKVADAFADEEVGTNGVVAIPIETDPQQPDTGTDSEGRPLGGATSTATEDECLPEISWAEQWAEQVKAETNFGIFDEMMDARIDQLFGQQCIGKLITLMQTIMSTVDTIRTMMSSADIMGAVIAAAAGAIVRAILDQVFNWLTTQICNATNTIINTIDNVAKNLMCFKNPLFTMPNDPLRIPIDIEDISCSGIAINPLYFSGNPNQPLGTGQIGGIRVDNIRSGDRPFFCPLGYKATTARGQAANGGPAWNCEPDPSYVPRDRTPITRRYCAYNYVTGLTDPNTGNCIPLLQESSRNGPR